jgi:hypothetical protein
MRRNILRILRTVKTRSQCRLCCPQNTSAFATAVNRATQGRGLFPPESRDPGRTKSCQDLAITSWSPKSLENGRNRSRGTALGSVDAQIFRERHNIAKDLHSDPQCDVVSRRCQIDNEGRNCGLCIISFMGIMNPVQIIRLGKRDGNESYTVFS